MKKILSIILLCFCFSATAQNSTVICIDPLANNYFALMDTLSDTWNTSYFNPDSDVYTDSFYDDYSYGDSTEACAYDFGCTNPLAFNFNPEANVNNGTCEYDIMTQLNQSFDAWNVSINLQEGWNMIGYGCPSPIDVSEGLSIHTESIAIVKDNDGSVYMPEFGFNGIGDFTPGFGYQIKLSDAIEDLSLCDWYVNDIPEDNIVSLLEENDALQEDVDFMAPYFGCLDTTSCNYASSALVDDESCEYPETGYNCDGFMLITQANIYEAADVWILNPDSTETIYGHISDWDVSNVTDMSLVFYGAGNFTSDLSSWDVSNVTDMGDMFQYADNFTSDLSSWDVSNVTDMSYMFYSADNFNSDLSSWDVSNVTDMASMFQSAYNFTSDLSSWDVSNVTDMGDMFQYADNFTSDLSSWDVSNVTDMASMFQSAYNFTSDLSSWDVSNVTDMASMFRSADNFTSDLSSWGVSNVTDMARMFQSTDNFTSDLSSWDVSNVTDMTYIFSGANLSLENRCAIQNSFSTNTNWPYDWSSSYCDCLLDSGDEVCNIAPGDFNFHQVANEWISNPDSTEAVYGHISDWDVSNVTDMSFVFNQTNFTGDLSSWDVSNVTDMSYMFIGADNFNSDLSSWDVSNVTDMSNMFYSSDNFNSDLSSWDVSNVTNMNGMFSGYNSLSEDNKCAIQTSFSSNPNWPYEWCE